MMNIMNKMRHVQHFYFKDDNKRKLSEKGVLISFILNMHSDSEFD